MGLNFPPACHLLSEVLDSQGQENESVLGSFLLIQPSASIIPVFLGLRTSERGKKGDRRVPDKPGRDGQPSSTYDKCTYSVLGS